MRVGYHASHEQFSPSELLACAAMAEDAGFGEIKCSDHFHPWTERQGQSGFAWSWLGAAMAGTSLPFGTISAPGYRYHPAVLAQAAATVGEMFPGRLWLALGSGEAINEAITGGYWPDKAERNARLLECVEIIRALFAGETVTHRGRVEVVGAKLYSRPDRPVPIFGAAVTPATAAFAAKWAEGLLVAASTAQSLQPLVNAYRSAGGRGPIHAQVAVCYSKTLADARIEAVHQWPTAALGGEVMWDLRRPADFDLATRNVTADDLEAGLLITDSADAVLARLESLGAAGADTVHLHQVARDQAALLEAMQPLLQSL